MSTNHHRSVRASYSLSCALALMASLSFVHSSHAETYFWDPNGATAGFPSSAVGIWGSSAFWSIDSTGSTAGANTTITSADDVNFGTATLGFTASSSVEIFGSQNVRNITFGAGNSQTLNIRNGTKLTLGSGSTITNNNSVQTLQISSALAGTSGFIKEGTGTLDLRGNNSGLTGGINISRGTLRAFQATALNGTGAIRIFTECCG